MAWDAKKHKVIASKRVKTDDVTVIVELYSYDKGPVKLGFRQEIEKKNGDKVIAPLKGLDVAVGLKVAIAAKKLCKAHIEGSEEI